MEIGHKVKDSDEQPQAYGHGEVEDGEPDAEHHGHAERHQSLSADIVVELPLHILRQLMPEGAILLWEDANPILCEVFVVEQDEEHI